MKEGVIEKKILVHDYLDGICPNCQGSNLETFYEETGDGFHTEEVTCLECGAIVKSGIQITISSKDVYRSSDK